MAVKYTRDGVTTRKSERWVVEGRSVAQSKRRNLAIFMGLCILCVLLLLFDTLQGKKSNRWLPARLNYVTVTDKTQELKGEDTEYYLTVEVKVPPAVPSEKKLLIGNEEEIETKSEIVYFKKSVRVDQTSWDTSSVGDILRAQYMIKMQRDDITIQGLQGDFMNAEPFIPDAKSETEIDSISPQ